MKPTTNIDIQKIREDFPVLHQKVYNKKLVYFDNGATTQKPQSVIDKINELHSFTNSSIHRGVHYLSGLMTEEYEAAREKVRSFINAKEKSEIIFSSGTTASINMIAFSFGEKYISEGDEIIISEMEHHSNIVPWQLLCERKKAVLKIIPFDENGELIISEFKKLISDKTKLISVTHTSNTLGTVNPVKEIINIAHKINIPVLLDGAQAIQHEKIDVQELDVDFYVFSGHKIYGPTGTGILYGKQKWLEEMPPWQGGGDMVDKVSFTKTTFNSLPFKFEAGTPNYIGAIGLAKALDYVENIGVEKIKSYEKELLNYSTRELNKIDGLKILGHSKDKISVQSFIIESIHPYDMGMILDKLGVAVRTGSHCAQPVMDHFGIDGSLRASMVFYNSFEEIDILIDGIKKAQSMLK
ncbi:MAG: cysteine desulfurase [Bacteroidales bacterium]|nr:cysteine desulfurase [Bacteroidales bacterium]MCF8390674.1 cysteine desulfurase [Bacteroidales bacterium]